MQRTQLTLPTVCAAAIVVLPLGGCGEPAKVAKAPTLAAAQAKAAREELNRSKVAEAAKDTSSSLFEPRNPYTLSQQSSTTELGIGRLLIFGDSYSALKRKSFPNWAEQLRAEGSVAMLEGYAKSGAYAAGTEVKGVGNTFASQLARWTDAGGGVDDRTLTVVFLGYNDIGSSFDLALSEKGYTAGLDRIIGRGGTRGDRHILAVVPHDWSKNPGQAADPTKHGRAVAWRRHIIAVAQARRNVIPVDWYSVFEGVRADPGRFNLTNVSTPACADADRTALWYDPNHPGRRGQELIGQVIKAYLTRGWNSAHSLDAGTERVTGLASDITNSLPVRFAAAEDEAGFFQEVRFASGSTVIRPKSHAELECLADVLAKHEHSRAMIVGHTDAIGSRVYNRGLSRQRAEAVKAALIGYGVAAARLATEGRGESKPLADNTTEANRQLNRRVEIHLLLNT